MAENLLNRRFQMSRPNRDWVGDITNVSTIEGQAHSALHTPHREAEV